MLDLQKLLRPKAARVQDTLSFHFSARDFYGFEVKQPVTMHYSAAPEGDAVRLRFGIEAKLEAPCSRCLAPAAQPLAIEGEYLIRAGDLSDKHPQLPILPGGLLDLEELAYGEIVIETPPGILCREDCAGLCQRCGLPAAQCGCQPENEGDPRLQVLRSLLDDEPG